MSPLRWTWRAVLASALSLGVVVTGLVVPSAANAVTTVYEIEGNWASDTPDPVKSGTGLTTVWRYNVNDADPAPLNPSQDNVTITFTAQHAIFTELPSVCLTSGVTPVSSIQNNGATLVCNLGTRDLGTAELLLAGVEARGVSGDKVSLSASIGTPGVNEAAASLPPLSITNPFAMDMKFDGGTPGQTQDGTQNVVTFPWSLRHAPGSTAGPNSVSYTLNFSASGGETIAPSTAGCTTQGSRNPGYPYSGSGFAANQTAPFPTSCTLVQTARNVFRLTLTGIDYSKTLDPTVDSTGTALPTEWDVVAAGKISVRFTYANPTTISFTSNAPTYTSTGGETSSDIASNNGNSRASTRGTWTGGWVLNRMNPPVDGTVWTDTYRTMAGQPALATSGVRPPQGSEDDTRVCTILDTKYVTFASSRAGTISSNGVVTPYSGVVYEYFTGTGTNGMVDPNSANYNPNNFGCDGSTGTAWTSTLPTNLSTIKAVRATFPASANIPEAVATMYTYTTIKSDVSVGQDVWTWTSYKMGAAEWVNPHRTTNAADVPLSGTRTPNSRYPYTGGGRDVLRIVAGQPHVSKSVDQKITMPGATVNFTLTYRVDAPVNSTVNGLTLSDVLPAGLSYVPGSASVTPTSISGQTLNWTLNNVSTNTDYTILLSATVASSAAPGTVYTNTVNIDLAGARSSATATTRVRDGGYTFITKTADDQRVPHVDGAAQDGWTVRLTSADSAAQTFTDTVDILPYNGDGRGTSFSGSYQLSGPVTAVSGATVYYTTASPATLKDDPADASNGSAGSIAGNTVGWSTTFDANATAVRVIGPSLAAGASQSFKINVKTTGATFDDMYVNRAEARASRTELTMRTSSWFQIAAVDSLTMKKYVQDADGNWHDAQNVDDYPSFHNGDTVKYRLVVTNTGDQTLTDVTVTDDKVDLAALDPLPAGLSAGAVIPELKPGASNAVTIEYDVLLTGHSAGTNLINNACATPSDTNVDPSCDPAGLIILPSSLSWEKVSSGSPQERLTGSEWELVKVDDAQNPSGTPIQVSDCAAADASSCTGPDKDPAAGAFLITDLPDGDYRLTETRAPAGYVLDSEPRYITVQGVTAFASPITNEQQEGPAMPLSGGVGTFGIFATAGTLGGLALLLVLLRRRRLRESAEAETLA
ncbi:SpaA isopeptide-forming pilin-related protein [Microbacterium sp. 2P01SA-2]|uniref:DUF7507 domain-containing protein n=1 Tax=unclassified Microbacterium TaxID=2609290 RepID=UPI00399FDAB6